jgi:hypothetical protein
LIDDRQIERNGFFTKDMFTGPGCGGDKLGVGIRAGTDDDRSNALIIKNSLGVVGKRGDLKISRTFFGCGSKHIGYGHKPSLRQAVSYILGMHPAYSPRTD